MTGKIHIAADADALSAAAGARWVELGHRAVRDRGAFHAALSGGGTPAALYRRLAATPDIDWPAVYVYWSDERSVPFDHPDSNFRMAQEALLSRVPIPPSQIHPIRARPSSIHEDARAYASLLRALLPTTAAGIPIFDLILLGLGEDGHVASLFPGTPVVEEREQPVAAVYVERLQTWRVSMTLPVIHAARAVLVLVSGGAKAPIVRRVFSDSGQQPALPAQRIDAGQPVDWYLDESAAAQLPEDYRT
jgi:6-phosphogluconolactonase